MPTPKRFADLSDQMAGMDIAILSTVTSDGSIAGRPMSNNAEVEYDGTPPITSPWTTRAR